MARGIPTPLTADMLARAKVMYGEGLSTHKISLELGNGINQERVRKALIKAGVEMRTKGEGNQTAATREAHRRRRAEEEIARRAKP